MQVHIEDCIIDRFVRSALARLLDRTENRNRGAFLDQHVFQSERDDRLVFEHQDMFPVQAHTTEQIKI